MPEGPEIKNFTDFASKIIKDKSLIFNTDLF